MTADNEDALVILSDIPKPRPDLLEFERYVKPLTDFIVTEGTDTPFVIGIFGTWGTGKTTLMKMIADRVTANEYPVVWFNPWLYRDEENLLVPLLQTIRSRNVSSIVRQL